MISTTSFEVAYEKRKSNERNGTEPFRRATVEETAIEA